MTQYTFDWEAGAKLRDEGMELVKSHTPLSYRDQFERVLKALAASGDEFTSEDVTAVVGQPPNHPNTVGALFNAAARRGLITKRGYRKSVRPRSHCHCIAVWAGKTPQKQSPSF